MATLNIGLVCFSTGTTVPEGYITDIPEGDIGTYYIYGHEDTGELYGLDAHNACMDEIAKRVGNCNRIHGFRKI